MDGVIHLNALQVGLAYVFALFVLFVVRLKGINREKEIVIAVFRMSIQLVLAGYALVFILDNPSPALTIGIIIAMEAFSIHTIFKRFNGRLSFALKKVIVLAMSAGSLFCIFYFVLVVVGVTPWYNPQYFIPVSGMIMGNTMTGVTLAVNALLKAMTTEKHLVEESLILGATPKTATKNIVNDSFEVAIMPTITNMMTMGIVILPGMMTGQILSGTSPTAAIAYQIAIMLAILGAAAITVVILLQLGYQTFFNEDQQLADGL